MLILGAVLALAQAGAAAPPTRPPAKPPVGELRRPVPRGGVSRPRGPEKPGVVLGDQDPRPPVRRPPAHAHQRRARHQPEGLHPEGPPLPAARRAFPRRPRTAAGGGRGCDGVRTAPRMRTGRRIPPAPGRAAAGGGRDPDGPAGLPGRGAAARGGHVDHDELPLRQVEGRALPRRRLQACGRPRRSRSRSRRRSGVARTMRGGPRGIGRGSPADRARPSSAE